MNKVQSSMPITDGEFTQPEAGQGDPSASSPMAERELGGTSGTGYGAGPDEHSLLSRPALPQGRRSLFRR
ncbi:MAG TPA: hypothetical protein VGC15_00800 [Acetobacteraceae bacterium]